LLQPHLLRLVDERRDVDGLHVLGERAAAAPDERVPAAGKPEHERRRHERGGRTTHQRTTRFRSRSGTCTVLTRPFPAIHRRIDSSDSAAASASDWLAPRRSESCPRTLPFTWTTTVASSSTASAGS